MAKSLAPQSIPQLLELLSHSGLLSDDQFAQARQLAQSSQDIPGTLRRWTGAKLLTPWQAAQLSLGQFVLKLGSYQLLDEWGEWDFGRAFQARHGSTQQTVTLKLLANRWLQPEERWRQSALQLRQAQQLKHPQLAPFHQVARVTQRTFLINESEPQRDVGFLHGEFGPATPEQARRLLHQGALGLAALHAAGLAHGCLHPRRLAVSADGVLRLQDLGLAPLAPELLELHRQRIAQSPGADQEAPFLPPAGEEITPENAFRWDVACLARIGIWVLSPVDPPRTGNRAAAPSWWIDIAATDEPRAPLIKRLEEAADREAPTWTAQRLADLLANPLTKSSPAQPPGAVRINTQRRRKRASVADDERLAAVRRLQRRRAAWLYGSLATTVVVLLAMLVISFRDRLPGFGGPRGGEPPQAEFARADAAGPGPREDQPDVAFPDADAFELPTPEAFAALPSTETPGPSDGDSRLDVPRSDTEVGVNAEDVADAPPPPADVPDRMAMSPVATDGGPAPEDAASEVPVGDSATAPDTEVAAAAPPEASPMTEVAPVLAGLPLHVDLPDREADGQRPVALLPLRIPPGYPMALDLVGGDRVLAGNRELRIEHAEGGTAERIWDVELVERNTPPLAVARLALEDAGLVFQWLPGSERHPESLQLRNCVLSFSAGTELHRLTLRSPVIVPSLAVDLERGVSTARWELPHPPDWDRCQLEFLGLEGPFPATRELPGPTIPSAQGQQWILVGVEPEDQGLALFVAAERRRQLELSVTSVLFVGDIPGPALARSRDARVTVANRRRWNQLARTRLAQAEQRQAQLAVVNPQAVSDRTAQQELARQKNLAEVDLATARQDAARMERLEQWAVSSQTVPARIHYRVYFELAGQQIELLRTEGAPARGVPGGS